MAAMKMEVSKLFPGADYVPFTPGEIILDHLAEPVDADWLRKLTGADFWGMYIINQDGSMKEALYNTYHGSREVQQEYRDAIWADFSIVTERLDHNDKLVLHMFGKDGWCVEAMRSGTVWTHEFKHSPNYRKVWHDALEDSITVSGEGVRAGEGYGYSGPVSIGLKRAELFAIKGELTPLDWTPLFEKTLRVHKTDGRMILVKFEPIAAVADADADNYQCFVSEFQSSDTSEQPDTYMQIDMKTADDLIDFLEWNSRGIPVE